MRISNLNIFIVPLMFALLVFSGYKLFWDNYTPFENSKRDIVATIDNPINTVKRKESNVIAWNDADKGDQLAFDDKIYTHDKSYAKINFFDGSSVALAENTLFKIEKIADTIGINLEKGMILTELSQNRSHIQVTLQGKKYEINSKNAKIKIIQNVENSQIVLLEGVAEVKSPNSNAQLRKNQFIEYNKQNDLSEIRSLQFVNILPTSNAEIFFSVTPEVNFSWDSLQNFDETKLVISSDRSFQNVIYESAVGSNHQKVSNLFEGTYYWKIVGKSNKTHESIPQRLTILRDIPPQYLNPNDNLSILKKQTDKSYKILLEWEKLSVNGYSLEIVAPNQKKTLIETKKNKYFYDLSMDGNYLWRVRIIDDRRKESPWGEYRKFSFEEIKLPPPPIIISPGKQYELTLYSKEDASIDFKWIPQYGIDEYELIIVKSNNPEEIIFNKRVFGSKFTWGIKEYGNFSWKIRSIGKSDNTEFGILTPFAINLVSDIGLAPENGTKIELRRPNQEVKFEWQSPKNKELKVTYIFEVSEQSDFKEIIKTENVSSESIKTSFPKIGVFYWRTRIKGPDNEITYSKPYKVIIEPTPPPQRPVIIPEQDINIQIKEVQSKAETILERILDFLIQSAYAAKLVKFVEIKWNADPDAKKYVLEIYQDPGLGKLLLKKTLSDSYFEWDGPTEGVYYWRIAIIDYWDRMSSFSKLSKINIVLPDKLKDLNPPSLITPSHNQQIILQKMSKLPFIWEGDERTISFDFMIAHDLDFQKIIIRKRTKETKITIDANQLANAKTVYWRVVATDRFKKMVNSKRRSLSLTRENLKPVQDIVKTPEKTPEKKYENLNTHVDLMFAPAKINYKQQGPTHKVNVDGVAINSAKLRGKYLLNNSYFTNLGISRESGKVFNDQSFSTLNVYALFGTSFRNFGLSAGPSLYRSSYYTLQSATSLQEKTASKFSLLISGEYEYRISDNFGNHAAIALGLGGVTELNASYKLRYLYTKNIHLITGVSFLKKSFEADANEISTSEIQLLFGVGRVF